MRKTPVTMFAAFAVLLAAACGGGQPEPAAPPPPPAAPAAPEPATPPPAPTEAPAASGTPAAPEPAAPAAPAATKSWNDMSHEERMTLMKKVVQPQMAAAFQELDAAKYKDFNCTNCHGAGAKQGKFDMPNPKLPKLNAKNDFKKHKDKTPAMLTFMMNRVAPEMALILGLPPYDPATHAGFGCGNCHLFEK